MEEIKSVQWFPGHMARARRQIEQSLKLVDIVIELTDARIPESSRNPVLDQIIRNKPRIVVLNKFDMADPAQTERWVAWYKAKGVTAVALDCKSGRAVNRLAPAVRQVLAPQIAKWEAKGMTGRPIRAMIVGIPNVGKSSLINKMCAGGKAGKAEVRDQPGVTRRNTWFAAGKGFELLDTPGVLWPKFEDQTVGLRLAFTGAVRDEIMDTEGLAALLLKEIAALYPAQLSARYKLDNPDYNAMQGWEILSMIGRKRGMLISGGEIDTERAANMVLDEFRGAKIGRITLEQQG